MIPRSCLRARSPRVPLIGLCSALFVGLLWPVPPIHADTLSPQRIQELTDLGAQVADREKALKEAEQQLQDPNLSSTDRERLTKEAGDHRDFIKTTKDGIAAQGADQKRVLDRAIEARTKQYQLKDAKAAAAKDPSDKKAQRTVKRLETELQNDYKDIGKLPVMASAAIPGSGSSSNLAANTVVLDECEKQEMLSSAVSLQYIFAGTRRLDVMPARVAVRSAGNPLLHLVQRGGGQTQIEEPNLPPESGGPRGTQIKGKVPDVVTFKGSGSIIKPNGPGTIEFTDKDGKSYSLHVDNEGTYSGWVPSPDFTPVKAELKTGSEQDNQTTTRWVIQDGKMHEVEVVEYSNAPDPRSGGRIITGRLPFGQRGTLELTDKDGKSHWLHVDEKGNYSGRIETPDFKPVKAELQTGPDMQHIQKTNWTIPENGWWHRAEDHPAPKTLSAMTPPVVPPGQSGFALLSAPGSATNLSSAISMKGHMNFVATEQIKTSTDVQIQFESVAHVEEEDNNQTATMYAHFGYDPSKGIGINPNWAIGPTWTNSDAKPPFVAPIDGKGDFTVTGLNALSKPCTTLHVAYGFNHVSTALNRTQLGGDVNVTMNTNPSWTAGLTSDVGISLLKHSYMNEGAINGVKYEGIIWHTPIKEAPVIYSGQISEDGYNRLSWGPFKNSMVYGESNPGALTKPIPGLRREDWPRTDAYPGPVLRLPASWLEE